MSEFEVGDEVLIIPRGLIGTVVNSWERGCEVSSPELGEITGYWFISELSVVGELTEALYL